MRDHKKPESEFTYQVRDNTNKIFRKDIETLDEAKMIAIELIKDSEAILALPKDKQRAKNWALRNRTPSIWVVEAKPLLEDLDYTGRK